jgi:hypothetical protein
MRLEKGMRMFSLSGFLAVSLLWLTSPTSRLLKNSIIL